MTHQTRVYVSTRPGWYQIRERPVNDPELRAHMRRLAAHALKTQDWAQHVTVTAICAGKSWALTLTREWVEAS